MSNLTLGLDLGPNSIGWALIDTEQQEIVALGSRIFPEGVDNFDSSKEKSRNEDRRISRGMRRQIARRARRKLRLRVALVEAGLLPATAEEQAGTTTDGDLYQLRARAADPAEKLTPYEIGRVLLHLNKRRGFLSNRKQSAAEKEDQGIKQEMNELEVELAGRTLGQYLNDKLQAFVHGQRQPNDHIRRRHTRRNMLTGEFERIWEAQSQHHPLLLTDHLAYGRMGKQKFPCKPGRKGPGEANLAAYGLFGMMFFQRTMYWPKSVVGLCELEPKEKRCPRADRRAQWFRILQEVNNLRYLDTDQRDETPLDEQQRTLLIEKLAQTERATFDQIRTCLGFLDSVKFNLERGKRASLGGHITDVTLAKITGKDWHARSEEEKNRIVELLLESDSDDESLTEQLVAGFGFTPEQAAKAIGVELKPEGYGALSRKALDKLLPHLRRGLVYMHDDPTNSALAAAGYLRRDQLQLRLFDELPDPKRVQDSPIGDIPNPVVKRALVELRKVVNTILHEQRRLRKDPHWKPAAVHVEMARSVRMGAEARREYNTRIRAKEKERDDAAQEIRAMATVRVNRDSILRYLLWKAQSHECIYCSKPISQQQLYGGDVDVDHILPYSRCLDDSQMNKVVCHRHCNHEKGQRTPYEWLADTNSTHYAQVCQQAGSLMRKGLMPYPKYRKFLQKELELDKFIARQLTDTGYIARATAEYLRCLFEDNHAVLGLKGEHTAELRRQWGLNTVLRLDDEDLKNREDHRHHAVDAVVLALTDRSRLQTLSFLQKSEGFDPHTGEVYELPEPWEGFRSAVVEKVNQINVSHRAERTVSGALHEETLYGPTAEPGVFVVRKAVESLSSNEVPLIRDETIRRIVEARLKEHSIDIGRGQKVDPGKWKQALASVEHPLTMPSGVPIKKVRVLRKEQTIRPIRQKSGNVAYVKPGSNHHLCLFEWEVKGKKKRSAEFTSMLEAAQRVKNHETIIRRTPDPEKSPEIPPNAKFLMSLSRGEMVLAEVEGEEKLLVFNTAPSTNQQMRFFEHTDARALADRKIFRFQPGTFKARKVTVDVLGRIRWAND